MDVLLHSNYKGGEAKHPKSNRENHFTALDVQKLKAIKCECICLDSHFSKYVYVNARCLIILCLILFQMDYFSDTVKVKFPSDYKESLLGTAINNKLNSLHNLEKKKIM